MTLSAAVLLAQAGEAAATGDIWTYIDRFGVAIVGLVVTAGFLGWLVRKIITYLMEQIASWEKRWQDEHDLRTAAEHRADVAIEQAKTANAFYEALKQQAGKMS